MAIVAGLPPGHAVGVAALSEVVGAFAWSAPNVDILLETESAE